MIRVAVLDPVFTVWGDRLVVEFIDPEVRCLPAVHLVCNRGEEHRLAACIAQLAKENAIDVHTFVHALALELRGPSKGTIGGR